MSWIAVLSTERRGLLSAAIVVWLLILVGSLPPTTVAQKPTQFNIRVNIPARTVAWDAQQLGQTGFRISGAARYGPACELAGQVKEFGTVQFSEELAADATAFHLPAPQDPRLTLLLFLTVTVTATDAAGQSLGEDGLAVQVDPIGCPSQVPTTGGGPGSGESVVNFPPWALIALGAALLSAGGLMLAVGLHGELRRSP